MTYDYQDYTWSMAVNTIKDYLIITGYYNNDCLTFNM